MRSSSTALFNTPETTYLMGETVLPALPALTLLKSNLLNFAFWYFVDF